MNKLREPNLIQNKYERGILIVEDDQIIVDELSMIFKERGFTNVFIALNAADAISMLARKGDEIYVITLDMRMPNQNGLIDTEAGLQVVRHLANVHKYHVGIIIFTGYPSASAASTFRKLQSDKIIAIDYLTKDLTDIEKLLSEVENAMNSIYEKRLHSIDSINNAIVSRLDSIEKELAGLSVLKSIENRIDTIAKRQGGFLQQLGFELIKIILICLAVLALLSVGTADFIKKVFGIL